MSKKRNLREIKEKLEGHGTNWDCSYGIERFVPYGTIRKRSDISLLLMLWQYLQIVRIHKPIGEY